MYKSPLLITLAALPAFSFALPQSSSGGGILDGYATFNQYSAQKTGVDCTPELWQKSGKTELVDNRKIYGAAAGDLSRGLGPYECNYSEKDINHDETQCTTPQPGLSYKLPKSDGSDYKPPYCPGARCGTCYTITNPKNGKKITVQIIDACPANTAFNYCKTIATNDADIVGPRDRCGSADVNSLDIDTSAYAMLSDDGEGYQSGVTPNLNIKITSNPSCSV